MESGIHFLHMPRVDLMCSWTQVVCIEHLWNILHQHHPKPEIQLQLTVILQQVWNEIPMVTVQHPARSMQIRLQDVSQPIDADSIAHV